ncbi:hypothetical protein [Amycolatopsis solani]|uniref:hypothetical protein n=1 Tax=Amycolatopsis solani TaxID=3028615 RepID=UPI0025B241AB|nr:hypothetical protein [Amycolatopsis sp. MEP2-6]
MSGLVYVDLDAVRLVVDGVAHRLRLARMPLNGERLVTLCRVEALAAFGWEPVNVVPATCGVCAELHASHRTAESARLRACAERVAEPTGYPAPAGLTHVPDQPSRGLRRPPQRRELTS